MTTRSISTIIFLLSAVSILYGLKLDDRAKDELDEPTEEDCMKPPMRGHGHQCCRVPKERIWGDLRSSIHKCLKAHKSGYKPMSQEMGEEAVTPMNDEDESIGTSPRPSDSSEGHRGPHGRPMNKPHRLPRHQNESCFMECVFEDQGFILSERGKQHGLGLTKGQELMNKLVNKFALIGRLDRTLEKNEQWHKVAVAAVETCYQMDLKIDTNTTCQSGSEEIFRCIFKYLFFNCPNWSQNQYCTSLKKFYEKCPSGPPPVMNDSHQTSMPEEMETLSTTEPQKYSE